MPIVGTAGHVDHGKSTLVELLTGRDPDRLAEEKRRGLTIDLGFAWAEINGVEIGFVDVPGHERFIKNMLAGVIAVDCALLVVAADSGWMPQTEEHVRVLDMLGAPTGVIAITRTDLVDDDTVDLAALEIADEVAGTALAEWPIIPVSAITGRGIGDLREALARRAVTAPDRGNEPFRMWVDRSFVIHGAGSIATGTVLQGTLRVDDEVEIHPGERVRVRGLHHHDEPVDVVVAGQRAAVNLAGVGAEEIPRGTLIAASGTAMATSRLVMTVEPGRGYDEIPDRGAFHIHTGTADRLATIRKIADGAILVHLSEPVGASAGDRVILRESGRQAVVGGGTVVDPSPPEPTDRTSIATIADAIRSSADRHERADALLASRGTISIDALSRATGGGQPTRGSVVGEVAVAAWFIETTADKADSFVSAYHEEHPRRAGVAHAELASRLEISKELLDAVVAESKNLETAEGAVRQIGFGGGLSTDDEKTWHQVRTRLEASFDVPRASQLGLDPELLHAVVRRGDLIRIETDLVFTADQVAELTDRITELEDGFTVSAFKDHFGMARRQSVPMLEWFDKTGVTLRQGDGRKVRRRNV